MTASPIQIEIPLSPPLAIMAYHKTLQLLQLLEIEPLKCESLANRIAQTVVASANPSRDEASVCLTINSDDTPQLSITVNATALQERISLAQLPDPATLAGIAEKALQNSYPQLLQLIHHHHQNQLKQHRQWRERAGQLSLEMKRQTQSLQYQTMHDTLTGLPNRRQLFARTRETFMLASRQQIKCALVLMDLNDFKEINDSLGHQAGDRLLQEVSQRLRGTIRQTDILARLGGDEFATLLTNCDAQHAAKLAEKIHTIFDRPFEHEDTHITISASIGITEFPTHGEELDTLMRKADVAMYYAKENELNYSIYDVMQDKHSLERMTMLKDLNSAIKTDGMELYYQPQVGMKGKDKRLSAEALIRWNHPERGMVFPDQFIPLAEDSGLVLPMTWWVLKTAMKQCVAWHRDGLPVNVSINIPADFLHEERIVERIRDYMTHYQLPPNAFALEITENMLMSDPCHASNILKEIHALGIDVSIDDFGTGYSSLAYLKHIDLDELKIDRSFVVGMSEHNNDAVIVNTVISMAHHMGLRVVAEGAESREDWDRLDQMGCDIIQGYFISRPQPLEEVTAWFKQFSDQGLILKA